MEEDNSDWIKLPTEDKCTHSKWKARVNGYEEAAKLFRKLDETSSEWSKYNGLIKKIVVDSNAPAQEKGLEAVLAYVENCPNAGKYVLDICAGICQKCVIAPKTKTKELSVQICLMLIEIEKADQVIDELLKGTEAKNPKIVAPCINIITTALREFGPNVIRINKLSKRLAQLLVEKDVATRKEAKDLLIEIYRWVREAYRTQITSFPKLDSNVVADLEKIKNEGLPKPTRLLRSQQAVSQSTSEDYITAQGDDDESDGLVTESDPYDLIEPVDILSKLPKEFYPQLEAKKWTERRDQLEFLEKILANAPKLENGDYGELMKALKKIAIKDSNVVCVGIAVKCIAYVATGLKKKFHGYVGGFLLPLLEKFKEKKQNVVVALRDAVDAIYNATTLELIMEDLVVALENKNPSVRAETTNFVSRCCKTCTSAIINKKLQKVLIPALLKSAKDGEGSVRDAAAEALGTVKKVIGERAFDPYIQDLPAAMKTKIEEYCNTVELLVKEPKKAREEPKDRPKKGGSTKPKAVRPQLKNNGDDSKLKQLAKKPEGDPQNDDIHHRAGALVPQALFEKISSSDMDVRVCGLQEFIGFSRTLPSEPLGDVLLHVLHTSGYGSDNDQAQTVRIAAMKEIAEKFIIQGKGNVEYVIELGKKDLSSSDTEVRDAGLAIIGALHRRNNEVIKARSDAEKAPSAESQKVVNKEKTIKSEVVNYGDKVYIDISSKLSDALVSELTDKNWKVRQEAVSKIQAIVTEAKYISPNLGDPAAVIGLRIVDSNTKIAASAITLIESLTNAMGPPIKQYVKVFLPHLFKALGDSKSWIRTATISCLNTMLNVGGYKEFFENEMIADAVRSGTTTGRIELWGWLSETLTKIPPRSIPREELISCVPTLFANMEDRNAEVRKNAFEVLNGFMMHVGFTALASAAESLKAGPQVVAALERLRGTLPSPPPKGKAQQGQPDKKPQPKMVAGSSATITKPTKPKANVRPSMRKKEDENVESGPLLSINNLKHQRVVDEQKMKTLRWNFTSPRPEFVEQLKDQMTVAGVNKMLIANMFHADFKYHLKAIDSLIEDQQNNEDGLVCNLDLILKWMTLRFFDTNPSVLLKGLDYLETVFLMLCHKGYTMLDTEASSFFPYLILKIGDPKDVVRATVRKIFRRIGGSVYSATKQFLFVIEGLKSKNARQRAECLDQLGWLIETYGLTVCHPNLASLKEIAKHIADRDTTVRNAALNTIVAAYFLDPEKTMKTVGHLSEKETTLLEERIKRAAKNRPVASIKPLPFSNKPDQSNPQIEHANNLQNETFELEGNEAEEPEEPYIQPTSAASQSPAASSGSSVMQPNKGQGPYILDPSVIEEIECNPSLGPNPSLTDVDTHFMKSGGQLTTHISSASPMIKANPSPPTAMNHHQSSLQWQIGQIANPEPDKAMSAIARLEAFLKSEKREQLVPMVDYLVMQIVNQLMFLSQTTYPDVVNGYRAIFTFLMQLCSYPELSESISSKCLYKLIGQSLLLLTEHHRLESFERNEMFVRVVNSLVIRLLDSTNKTNMLCALIKMLYDSVGNSSISNHYQDLVIKCMWKMHRSQADWDGDLNYPRILTEIHIFLEEYPTSWWKEQPAEVPLRTIKTMIHSMVKIRGVEVREHLKNVTGLTPDSELSHYIRKLIKHLKLDENHGEKDTEVMPRLSKEIQEELSRIFQMVGDVGGTSEGIKRLYDFKKSHPEVDIDPFMSKTTPFFQEYIKKELASLEVQIALTDGKCSDISKKPDQGDLKKLTEEAESMWHRLQTLQEQAGCPHRIDKSEKQKANKYDQHNGGDNVESIIKPSETGEDHDIQSIQQRLDSIKRAGGRGSST